MIPHEATSTCSQLAHLAAIFGSDAELPIILEALDKLPDLFSALNKALAQAPTSEGDATDLPAIRMTLRDLRQSLIHVEKRLQCEHHSILLQLHELSAQQEWAQLSRQSG